MLIGAGWSGSPGNANAGFAEEGAKEEEEGSPVLRFS